MPCSGYLRHIDLLRIQMLIALEVKKKEMEADD